MANRKISQFSTVTDITTVSGLAGYNATTNIQISGSALVTSLENNLYTPFGPTGSVLTIDSNGVPAWEPGGSGAASNLGDVLTAGNESDDGQILKMVDAGEYLEIYANSIKHTTIANDFEIENEQGDLSLIASQNIEIESGGELRVKPNTALGTPGIGYVLTAKNTSGDLEWSQFANASPLNDVLANGSGANPGQSITFAGGGGIINVFSVTGSNANGSNEVKASGGNIEVNSVNNDVILKGGGDLYLENTGLGTAGIGDYLVADGASGKAKWFTDPKAFVTLTGSPTWIIRDGYNATWNVGSGSETLTITCADGDSGTLIVTTTTGEITWPAGSLWVGGTEPTLTNGVDVFSFIYDGTNYYWSYGQDFS